MTSLVDPTADGPAISTVVGAFVLLAALAWLASPGVSVAVGCYGALLVSEHLCRVGLASDTRLGRAAGFLGLALSWLIVLAYALLVLPSNFGAAVI